jgi:tripartite-type tricarboxylate transporter receptor subunit TctC
VVAINARPSSARSSFTLNFHCQLSVIIGPKSTPNDTLSELVEASKKGQSFNVAAAGACSMQPFAAEMLNVKYGVKRQPRDL